MKKIWILVFMMFVLVSVGNSQYYDDSYGYDDQNHEPDYAGYYDDNDYDDNYLAYNYGYEDALPYIRVHGGPVYYWIHPHRDIYFVLVGRRIFIMPGYSLRPILYRLGWYPVAMDRFLTLSCSGLHYYDNYVRFNYYYNHYRRYNYGSYYNSWARNHYRDYYRNRRRSKSYFQDWNRVIGKRRVIRKNTLSSGSYDRYGSRNRNTTYNNNRTINSTRSATRYNRNTTTDYDRYKSSTSQRSIHKKQGASGSYTPYSRKISGTSQAGYNPTPSPRSGQKVSDVTISRYKNKSTASSRSNYSQQKVKKIGVKKTSSKSSKSSGKTRKISKKHGN